MNLRELNEAIAALAYSRPDCETNITAVENVGTDVIVSSENSALLEKIEDLMAGEANLTERVAELEAELAKAEKELKQANELLAEFKEDGGAAVVARYRENAQREQDLRKQYAAALDKARAECVALRKRKGIDAGFFAHARDLMSLADSVARGKDAVLGVVAAEMVRKIRATP